MALAQGAIAVTNANPSGQHELGPMVMKSLEPGEKQCGQYFVLIPKYKGGDEPGIMFAYKDSGVGGLMGQKKFKTIIDPSKEKPTIEIVNGKNGTVDYSTVLVHIARADYVRATACLPKP